MFIQDHNGEWSGLLDTRKIGAYISRLRKERDMTQAELAERLNISHQAVSKWERGESLPDIGTIPAVAALFGLTVDELLRADTPAIPSPREEPQEAPLGAGGIVERLAAGEPEQAAALINDGEARAEDLAEVAPIVKASTLSQVAKHLDRSRISWDLAVRLAPFLPEASLEELVRHAMEDRTDWQVVVQLAPFIGRRLLSELTEQTMAGTLDYRLIVSLAPFLDPSSLDRLIARAEDDGLEWQPVLALAPFLSRETLTRLTERAADGALDPARLIGLAPFLDRGTIARLLKRIDLEQAGPELAAGLAPFLDQTTLASLVRGMLERSKPDSHS